MTELYDDPVSGNGYKVRLTLAQVNQPYEYHVVQVYKGETRTPEFLSINPNGKIPTVVLDDGRMLCESNAICWYFANNTHLWPEDSYDQAQALQWMNFEQYSHEPRIAVARSILNNTANDDPRRKEIPACHEGGYKALDIMESHLGTHSFFAAEQYSIADIALYAYTHVAREGGFDLDRYPAIVAWLKRVAEQAGHVTLNDV